VIQEHGSNIRQNVLNECRGSFFAFRLFSSVPTGQIRCLFVTTGNGPLSALVVSIRLDSQGYIETLSKIMSSVAMVKLPL